MKINCVIIEDEPLAQKVLEKYISRVSSLHLISTFDNAIDASIYIIEHGPDCIFLDIEMPEMSGLELLKTLKNPPKVILTTAYSAYAAESYDYEVLDYLLKPIPFERFMKAVNKLANAIKRELSPDKNQDRTYIMLKEGKTNFKVPFSNIEYVQAYGNYLKIITTGKQILSRMKISDLATQLPETLFIRIHKSYLVALRQVTGMEGNQIILQTNKVLPIGKYYKRGISEILSE